MSAEHELASMLNESFKPGEIRVFKVPKVSLMTVEQMQKAEFRRVPDDYQDPQGAVIVLPSFGNVRYIDTVVEPEFEEIEGEMRETGNVATVDYYCKFDSNLTKIAVRKIPAGGLTRSEKGRQLLEKFKDWNYRIIGTKVVFSTATSELPIQRRFITV